MANIRVDSEKIGYCIAAMEHSSRELGETAGTVETVQGRLPHVVSGMDVVSARLLNYAQSIRREEAFSRSLSSVLEQIMELYRTTEEALKGAGNETSGREYHVDSVVFDDEGGYGGNQGHMESVYFWDPIHCWELLGYLREYFPNMSIFEAFRYFSHLNRVGCGYVALANTLFMEYADRPDEFERVFGFPMYKDGDLNFDRLILDIYARTDQAGFNDDSTGYPSGTLDDTRAEIMERYLEDRGVSVETQGNAPVTVDNFREITENGGKVILGYRHGNMYDANGNPCYINGGHAITVTGVTEDGRFIVSSWGEQYFIDPADIGADDTFMVFYYNS